ncbi:type II toxin-antitoxin system HicA family toxin [Synechococcus sp. C9]|uniref:type II toxin-antitoxin system HicA family toxin n=1 Tax=Synechococcus sp. C9 TaxID=102119 RepID=UPI00403FDF53
MTRLPRIKGQELIGALRQAGFAVIRVKGSHHFWQHADGRCTIVPVHRTFGRVGSFSQICHAHFPPANPAS